MTPAKPQSAPSALRIGERVVALCDDGLLVGEYALFDATETVLHATDPVSVREAGYMTTAARALGRLAMEGVTPELAEDAARALAPQTIRTYGRCEAARRLATELGPAELFDGAVFRAGIRQYEGMWLDLRALCDATSVPDAALVLQALHMAAALADIDPATPVHLSTAGATRSRRPSVRTFVRPSFDKAGDAPDWLRRIGPRAMPVTLDAGQEARLQAALLARVRESLADSAGGARQGRTRLLRLERALTGATPSGPPTEDELLAIERQIDAGDAFGVDERLDRLEARRGSLPGIRYLRARVALLRGEQPPRYVAQELSELARIDHGFHEAALGAARTWLAAGEEATARYYAHQLVDDPTARDSQRLVALEILETTPKTNHSEMPPPIEVQAEVLESVHTVRIPRLQALGPAPAPGALPPQMSVPPPAVAPAKERARPKPRYEPELVESLPLPIGSTEEDLDAEDYPVTPKQARIAMVRLARNLARDYRLWYRRTLRCDVLAVDAMQQHLRARFSGASIHDEGVAWELRRHGALLSEIVARALGGQWVDVGASEPGYWVMAVPPAVRTCPIGRVYRFVALGRQERDLVDHYLGLEEAHRRG